MRVDDLPWFHELCRKRYPENYSSFAAEGWLSETVLRSPLMYLAIRNEHAFCVSLVGVNPWAPARREATLVMLCAEEGHVWSALEVLRVSAAWAKEVGAAVYRGWSETKFDVGPLFHRLGAAELTARYEVTL